MIDIDTIKAVARNPEIVELAEFLVLSSGERAYPDYKKPDLMRIPGLVRYFFVFDYRPGVEDGLLIHYSGTFLDDFFKRNIIGCYAEDVYAGNDNAKLVLGLYRQAHAAKKIAYARRDIGFKSDTIDSFKSAESILFQCSADGETLDFGLGMAVYTTVSDPADAVYRLLD